MHTSYLNSSDQENEKIEEIFHRHTENRNLALQNKKADKQRVQSDGEQDLFVAVFDLDEILLTYKSFESAMFYKRRLNTYNFLFMIWELKTASVTLA